MYKQEPFSRRGSLRSLRSAPLLSTVLESTLSLTRIHPITSLELPGLDYAIESQSAIIHQHHRELGTSLRSGIAAITAGTAGTQPQTRLGPQSSVRETKRNKQPQQRALSRKLKPHIVADTVKQYISRAQPKSKGSQEQQPNMEFLRGVYAFMQVSRSSVDYNQGYDSITTTAATSTTSTSFEETSNNEQITEISTANRAEMATALRTTSSTVVATRDVDRTANNTRATLEKKHIQRRTSKTAAADIQAITEEEKEAKHEQQKSQSKKGHALNQKMLFKRKSQKQQQQ